MEASTVWLVILMCCATKSCYSGEPHYSTTKSPSQELLEIVCHSFEIPLQECTCENPKMRNFTTPDGSPISLCDHVAEVKALENRAILKYFGEVSKPYAAITLFSWIACMIGNGLVIAVAWFKGQELSQFKRLIVFLAFCDISFSCLEFVRVIPAFWTNIFIYGKVMCKFMTGGTSLGANIAVGLIVIISIERYLGIVNPFKRGLTRLMVNVLVLGNVLLAVSAVTPLYIFAAIDLELLTCCIEWPNDIGRKDSRIYNWFQLAFYTLLPCSVIFVLYAIIVVSLSRDRLNSDNVFFDLNFRKQRILDNRRVTITLFAVVLAFMLLVTPYRVVLLYFDIVGASQTDKKIWGLDRDLYFALSFTRLLYPLHVAVNPIIYCAVDAKWRRDVRRLLCRHASAYGISQALPHRMRGGNITRRLRTLSIEMVKTSQTSDCSLKYRDN